MPTKSIQFTQLNKSIDKTGLSSYSQDQKDGYWQEYASPDGLKLVWHKRPGLTQFVNLGENTPVDGLYYWTRQNIIVAVCNGKVFKVEEDGTTTDITGTATMTGLVRPTFADVLGTNLYIASSGKIGEFSTSTGAYLTDGDAPTTVRFVDTINQVLVGLNDNSERFDWSDAGDPTAWSVNFATNETVPDLTLSMYAANAYLYFWGQNSLEVWRDDGSTFVRELQGAIQRGTIAAYSVTEILGSFFWLDHTREVIRMDGFQPQVISNPELTRFIRSLSTASDAKGDYLRIAGKHFYILSFPTDEKTLAYDITLNRWEEWTYYDTVSAEHKRWLGNCVAEASAWNKILVGDRRTGLIYEISDSLTDDNGNTIRTVLRSDFIDHGLSDTYKFCNKINLVFKRADTATTPGVVLMRHREEGSTDWSDYQQANLEAQGRTEVKAEFRRLGKYKRRQWEFVVSDDTLTSMLSATENFKVGINGN